MNLVNHRELQIAMIQNDIVWHDVPENLSRLECILEKLTGPVDLILLPEMFATGFTLKPDLIHENEHQSVIHWMRAMALKYHCAIAGSHPFPEGDKFFNRLFFFASDGVEGHYDKRHLFPMEGENLIYIPGTERKFFELHSWKIFPLICYDLRFPVWSRNTVNFDLLIYASNWPAARNSTWETLLKARAIENQCYVAGINRVGTDGNGIRYIGNSQVISPMGEVLCRLDAEESYAQLILNKKILLEYRNKFSVLKDRDDFEFKS
jgi:omega-amidase